MLFDLSCHWWEYPSHGERQGKSSAGRERSKCRDSRGRSLGATYRGYSSNSSPIPQLPPAASITTNQLPAQLCGPTRPKVKTFAQAAPSAASVPVSSFLPLKAPVVGPSALALYPTIMIYSEVPFFCLVPPTDCSLITGVQSNSPLLAQNLTHRWYSEKVH